MIDPFNVWTTPPNSIKINSFKEIDYLEVDYDFKLVLKLHYVRIQSQLGIDNPRFFFTIKKNI